MNACNWEDVYHYDDMRRVKWSSFVLHKHFGPFFVATGGESHGRLNANALGPAK